MHPSNRGGGGAGGRPISWALNAQPGASSSSTSINSSSSNAGSTSLKLIGSSGRMMQQQKQQDDSSLTSVKSSSSSSMASLTAQRQQQQPSSRLSAITTTTTTTSGSTSSGGGSIAGLFVGSSTALASSLINEQQQNQLQQQQQIDIEEQQQEENRKLRLQLYVFVLRCISYSFNAKPTNTRELHLKQQQVKLKKQQLEQIIQLHSRFIRSGPNSFSSKQCPHQHLINKSLTQQQLKQLDELYERVHITFNRKFLQNERMKLLVESECCSQQDLRELFKLNADKIIKQSGLFKPPSAAQQHLARSGGQYSTTAGLTSSSSNLITPSDFSESNLKANKELILNSWLIKFESIIRDQDGLQGALNDNSLTTTSMSAGGVVEQSQALLHPSSSSSLLTGSTQQQQQQQQMTKEQLYQMFQNILNIKKFEHQLLYNALQLDSSDEQAAAIRRELDGRIARIAELERNKKLLPKFVLKEMESLYLEEARMSVNKLIVNLDSLPVMKGSSSANESKGGVYGLQKFRRYNNR